MSTLQSYRELIVWQKAMDLAEAIHFATQRFPKPEIYGSVSQLRRSSASVAANIAEGQGRQSTGEFRQFLGHARGSLLETETHLLLAVRVGYLTADQADPVLAMSAEVGRLINGLLTSLQGDHRSNN